MKQTVTTINAHGNAHAGTRARILNVLIACEESQAECKAFRELGHNAFSCDLQPARYEDSWHIMGDVTPLLRGETSFIKQNGVHESVPSWDLIIAHPPCTYLCRLSSVQMVHHGVVDPDRYEKMLAGRAFFLECLNAQAPFVAVENPVPMKRAQLPPPTTFACPSWFGVKYTKKTLYWLKNLPPIMPQIFHAHPKCYVQSSRGKYRSRTFPAMAEAIAEQWSSYILDNFL